MAHAEGGLLPPLKLRAEWQELEKLNFSEWTIERFNGWSVPFDGGSKVFFFESNGGESFKVMAASLAYWTAQDKKERRQVIFLIHKNRFFRVECDSDAEKNLVEKLNTAASQLSGDAKNDPELLKGLAELLESRKPIFKPNG